MHQSPTGDLTTTKQKHTIITQHKRGATWPPLTHPPKEAQMPTETQIRGAIRTNEEKLARQKGAVEATQAMIEILNQQLTPVLATKPHTR